MKTFCVEVSQLVEVTVDETKFDEKFMSDFRKSFYEFDTIEDHVRHLAQLSARNILSPAFIEGYGPPANMGIEAETLRNSLDMEIVES